MSNLASADALDESKQAYEKGDFVKAAQLLRPQAEKGNVLAQSNLGFMYANGQGVKQDTKEAIKWYSMAAKKHHTPAQISIGQLYIKGQGIPQDFKEAAKWYQMAAEQGDYMGQLNLGVMYINGQGVKQDPLRALMWIDISKANPNCKDNTEPAKAHDFLSKKLTPQQISEAQALTKSCTAKKFKGC
jgi:TPR repeat protein